MAQDTAKDVGPTISSIGVANLRPGSEIDLKFLPRRDFHSAKGYLVVGIQRPDEPIYGPVLAAKAVVGDKVLIDAFGRQAKFALGHDQLTKGSHGQTFEEESLSSDENRGCGINWYRYRRQSVVPFGRKLTF
jgi:hypothetical protein